VGAVRAHLLAQGDAALARMERELSSADFASLGEVCGEWDGATFTADSAVEPDEGTGPAVRFFPVLGWDPSIDAPITGPEVIYAFVPSARDPVDGADDDGDGLIDERTLVRVEGALVVTVLEDVVFEPGPAEPEDADEPSPPSPRRAAFTQVGYAAAPPQRAALELRFTLSRRIGRDERVSVTFAKVISLRNLM
jgi:hypothetical protein